MRTAAAFVLSIALVAALGAQETVSHPGWEAAERAFVTGGRVRLDLSAGDYTLRRGSDDRIRVQWRARKPERTSRVRVRLHVHGRDAEIETFGRHHGVKAEIELPCRTDLHLRMTAGDLTISGIEGNKDVLLRAGDLVIDVDDPSQYRHVNASLLAGDLSARPFGFSTGGLFRSFRHDGNGPFELRARLWAGDLRLRAVKN